ncbi:MAG: hypothetical protein ABI861_13615, partial [Panacibacter sp.]
MKTCSGKFTDLSPKTKKENQHKFLVPVGKAILCLLAGVLLAPLLCPVSVFSQKLEFSYSYFNLTRNAGGGTLQQGD